MDYGLKLKRIRKEKGMTLKDVAISSGFSTPYISEIERKLRTPSVNTIEKVCKALGITLVELFKNDEPIMCSHSNPSIDYKREYDEHRIMPPTGIAVTCEYCKKEIRFYTLNEILDVVHEKYIKANK